MKQLPQLLEGLLSVDVPDLAVMAVATDSRDVQPGALFIALAGFGGPHGLSFAEQAVEAGAIAVLWEPADNAPELPALSCAFVLAVPGLQHMVGVIAARFYGEPSTQMSVVGITGTDGKTSCAWLLLQAWQQLQQDACMVGTLGKGRLGQLERGAFTTPFPVELQSNFAGFAASECQNVAMEVSSHALDQGRVAATQFDVAVLTNLARDHLDYHGTVEAYAEAKQKLFDEYQPRAWVLNADDKFGQKLAAAAPAATEVITYGLGEAVLQARNVQRQPGLVFELCYQGQTYNVETTLLGDFNVYNLLAVAAVLVAQGASIEQAVSCLENIQSPPGRLELFDSGRARVVVDYAHTPAALSASLESLRNVTSGRVLCVFGCGGDRDAGKRPLMAAAAEKHAHLVWVTDDNPRSESANVIFEDIRAGFVEPERVCFVHDRASAIAAAAAELQADDILLVAGKGHEDYQLLGDERRYFSDREEVAALLGLPKPEALYVRS